MDSKKTPGPVAPRYITLKEAAIYLSLSPKSLYRMVDARTIPFSQINVRPRNLGAPQRVHYRFDRVMLDEFMAENAVIPPKLI